MYSYDCLQYTGREHQTAMPQGHQSMENSACSENSQSYTPWRTRKVTEDEQVFRNRYWHAQQVGKSNSIEDVV